MNIMPHIAAFFLFQYRMLKTIKIFAAVSFVTASLLVSFSASAQSLIGTSGLVTIPTARMQRDGDLSFGFSYFDKKYQDYSKRDYNVAAIYSTFTFLPFLEISVRLNRMIDYPGQYYTVDRVPSVRLRLLNEKKYLPAVVFGMQDFATAFGGVQAIHFNATYLVLSKKVSVVDLHLGYSSKIMTAAIYQFDGFFYGMSWSPFKSVSLFAEYDSRRINAGFQAQILKHFALNLAVLNFDSYAAGISCKIHL